MNVFARSLRANARGLLVWAAVLAFFVGVGTYKFTGMQGAAGEQTRQLLEQFPRVILAAFGMAETDVMEFGGFFAMIEFYAVVIVAVYALILGHAAVSREIVDGTGEFLFTRPVSRSRVLAEKLAAAVVCVAVMSACNAVTGVVAYAALDADVPNAGDIIAAGTTWVALEGLSFLALGTALAAVLPRPELALHAGAALVCVAYAASVALDMFGDDAGWLRALSPIRYVRMNDVAAGAVSADGMAALVLLAVLGLAVSLAAFRRRDL